MNPVICLLIGILLGVLAVGWVAIERQREVYEQLVASVEAERDKAVNESKVYQRLLFPVLNRVEAGLKDANDPTPNKSLGEGLIGAASASSSPAAQLKRPVRRRRMPFRFLFNEIRRASNTPQQKVDALANALLKQKVPTSAAQEKTHVAV